jgi:hypothetical protein
MPGTKEKVWIAEYLKCFNATEAARRSGYKWPGKQGPRNKLRFAELIEASLKSRAMTPDQVIDRLSDQAMAGYSEFIDDYGRVDLAGLRAAGKMHLVKGIKPTRYGDQVEFYDAQTALVHIGKHHKLFTEQTAFDGTIHIEGLENLLDRIYGKDDQS